MLQRIKDWLVGLGAGNPLTQMALRLRARSLGCELDFSDSTRIWIEKGDQRLALASRDLTFVPITMEFMHLFFDSLVAERIDGKEVLDFSQPAFHTYKETGIGFFFPSIPEEDPFKQYMHWHTPGPGDIVWDAGAYAGATTCLLAKLVGPTGRVYAFEPDDLNFAYLEKNLAHHGITNVVTVRSALSGSSGTTTFYMGGTMASGIRDLVVYSDSKQNREVPTLSMEDACREFGSVPSFVKMDIEGAELDFLLGAKEFLCGQRVHFAIESFHKVKGEYTYKKLDPIFREIGYEVLSSDEFGQVFTWARP